MTDTLRSASVSPTLNSAWWADAVVYQIYPRSFADSNGDGVGDLRGILERLDHLHELGVDVLWLSPIYRSPQDDNGYDISDYRDIDPAFGTLADFDELLAAVHERGMKLVMDLVVNHTSDEHDWFRESASSRDNPKRDWYWWRDPRPGMTGGEPGAEPNNWGSAFSGSAWQWHPETGQYYLHLFSRKQPDLNWETPALRAAVYEMMNWWLDRGVDGFRMDVINFISKQPDLPDGEVPAGALHGRGGPYFLNGPRIHEFLHEMYLEVFEGREGEFITVGEMPGVAVEHAQLYTNPERRELDMVFQFEHVDLFNSPAGKWQQTDFDLRVLKASFDRWQTGLESIGWNSLYWNNHDRPRVVSRYGNDAAFWYQSATALATVLHLQKGTPYIYQGEELGMTNVPFTSADDFYDIESVNHYAEAVTLLGHDAEVVLGGMRVVSRDNARTPVQWTADAHGGFTTGAPWMPANPNFATINAATQRGVAGSVFDYYRRLIALRHESEVVVQGVFELLLPEHESLFVFTRRLGADTLLVLANLSDDAVALDGALTEFSAGTVVIANHEIPLGGALLADTPVDGTLAPWEALVLAVG